LVADLRQVADVQCESGKAIICVIGENLRGTPGMLARVFGAISDINVRMISQGASEINISFVIEEKDVNEAVRRLHAMLLADLDGRPRNAEKVKVPASVSSVSSTASVVKSRRVRGNGSGRDKTADLDGASRKHAQSAVR
jgi:aspartate kinase